jgi:hypothetical protein
MKPVLARHQKGYVGEAHLFHVDAAQQSWRADRAEGVVSRGAVHIEQKAQRAVRARVQRDYGVVHDAELDVRH